jgi:hypothetical protein
MFVKVRKIVLNSGIAIKSLASFLKHPQLSSLLRLKVSPEILLQNNFSPENFSKAISFFSVGPTYKTTALSRQNFCNRIIIGEMARKKGGVFADIGVSDGSSSVDLIEKSIQNHVEFKIFDKYNFLDIQKKRFASLFYNVDNQVVYVELFCFLFFIYPLSIKIHKQPDVRIFFDNPILKKYNKKLEYFDVFSSGYPPGFDLIKCANVLNPEYFSKDKIFDGLKNLHRNLKEKGVLIIAQNTNKKEALLMLQKNDAGFLLLENHGYSNFLSYLGMPEEATISIKN